MKNKYIFILTITVIASLLLSITSEGLKHRSSYCKSCAHRLYSNNTCLCKDCSIDEYRKLFWDGQHFTLDTSLYLSRKFENFLNKIIY